MIDGRRPAAARPRAFLLRLHQQFGVAIGMAAVAEQQVARRQGQNNRPAEPETPSWPGRLALPPFVQQ